MRPAPPPNSPEDEAYLASPLLSSPPDAGACPEDRSPPVYHHQGCGGLSRTEWDELEKEHERVSALPREKPKVRQIATGKTFQQHWEESDDEQRHAYLKAAGVSALVVRKESFSTLSKHGTQVADDLVLDIPMNVVAQVGDKWAVNFGLGTLREQLQHVAAV